jgi:predicted  nucleic acid-binding Zn ribbon protein
MHRISIRYSKKVSKANKVSEEELFGLFDNLLNALRQNGQINGRDLYSSAHKGRMQATVLTVTKDALDSKYHNKYVNDYLGKIETLCNNKIEIEYVGRSEGEKNSICDCKEHNYFVLYYFNLYSSVICGSCEGAVTLFKLPKTYDNSEYYNLTSWEGAYKACVILDVHCGTGERWAMKQQCDYNSGLSKEGRAVAAKIMEVTGRPTYYFLSNFSKTAPQKDQARPCPSCGGDWHLDKPIHGYFRHKCDKCLLMSAYNNKG